MATTLGLGDDASLRRRPRRLMIVQDARRGQVYRQCFDVDLRPIDELRVEVLGLAHDSKALANLVAAAGGEAVIVAGTRLADMDLADALRSPLLNRTKARCVVLAHAEFSCVLAEFRDLRFGELDGQFHRLDDTADREPAVGANSASMPIVRRLLRLPNG